MSYGLKLGWGGPIGDYKVLGVPIKECTRTLVLGSYGAGDKSLSQFGYPGLVV